MISELATAVWTPPPAQGSMLLARLLLLQRPATAAGLIATEPLGMSSTAPIEKQLFESLSRSAVLVAGFSMHLPDAWRKDAIDQMRALLSFEAWDDDSNLLDEASTKTFLRFVIFGNVRRMAALGISNRRRLMATWTWSNRKLFIEFAAGDHCRAVYSFLGEFEAVRQAMDGNIGDAVQVFKGNGFDFGNATPLTTASNGG